MIAVLEGVCWGLLPARGGSKSIPFKNLAEFARRPLIDYVIAAAQKASSVSRTICSTDSDRIAAHCRNHDVEAHPRPAALAHDTSPVQATIEYVLTDICAKEGAVAEFCALLQPTSPFLLPGHIDSCVDALRANPAAGSAQTVVPCPHNHHAINQRIVEDGIVRFRFPEERRTAYNKQLKTPHVLFGNLVVFRSRACLDQGHPFPGNSVAVPVDRFYGFDADNLIDFRLGALLLEQGFVDLPHLQRSWHAPS